MLDQVGQMPFSMYVIKLDETDVTIAIPRSCVQLPEASSSVVLLQVEFFALLCNLTWHLAYGMNYLQC